MTINKEGYPTILITIIFVGAVLTLIQLFVPILFYLALIAGIGFIIFIVQFFRHPERVIKEANDQLIYSPADGKVVVMEEVEEKEYLNSRRLMISIFMSPLNVHCNRVPFSGIVKYVKHHPGKYLVAWHPKSSTDNERTTTVLENGKNDILIRQIAGAVARRICTYLEPEQKVQQGQELGFIKFGSRVDIFLPLDAKVKVELGQQVKGNIDVIAEFN